MNQVILTGNLGNDPETKYTQEGNPIAIFSMAFRSYGDKANWIRVSANNRLAEVVETYLHKGAKVAVQGILDQTKWEAEDGTTKTAYRLLANQIEFIKTDGRGFEGDGGDGEEEQSGEGGDVPF